MNRVWALAMMLGALSCMFQPPANVAAPAPVVPTPDPTPNQKPWPPPVGTSWHIQLNGIPSDTTIADVYVVDLFDTPQTFIDALHAGGRHAICYFNAGAWEDWRTDAAQFPQHVLGKSLSGWPGERWLDVRAPEVSLRLGLRLDLAVQKHCDGVDPDNIDGFTNDTGFPLTAEDQLVFNRFIADEAHRRGLAVGLKNDLTQIPDLIGSFDWALNEECFAYAECDRLTPFIAAQKPVFSIEYGGQSLADSVCPRAQARQFSTLVMPLSLDGSARIACGP